MTLSRNEAICQAYRDGSTQRKIGKAYGLTTPRIGQILRAAGLTRNDRKKPVVPKMAPILVSVEQKEALQELSQRTGSTISEIIEDSLVRPDGD